MPEVKDCLFPQGPCPRGRCEPRPATRRAARGKPCRALPGLAGGRTHATEARAVAICACQPLCSVEWHCAAGQCRRKAGGIAASGQAARSARAGRPAASLRRQLRSVPRAGVFFG